jgi:hypothetical protein
MKSDGLGVLNIIVFFVAFLVDQGHVAHHNAAPSSSAAACVGKSDHPLQQAETAVPRSDWAETEQWSSRAVEQ